MDTRIKPTGVLPENMYVERVLTHQEAFQILRGIHEKTLRSDRISRPKLDQWKSDTRGYRVGPVSVAVAEIEPNKAAVVWYVGRMPNWPPLDIIRGEIWKLIELPETD